MQGGVIGDFTIENAAITFTITGAATQDGNSWGIGPYPDMQLTEPLDPDDHLYVIFSTEDPPEVTDGCVALIPPGMALTVTDPDVELSIPRGQGDCWDGDVTVDWGDGTAPEVISAPTPTATHSYTTNGDYDVMVSAVGCDTVTFPVTITAVAPTGAAAQAKKKAAASTPAPSATPAAD